jgi:hypothetical protein
LQFLLYILHLWSQSVTLHGVILKYVDPLPGNNRESKNYTTAVARYRLHQHKRKKGRPKNNPRKSRMILVHLDLLACNQGAAQGERFQEGSSGNSWRIITLGTEPQGKEARPITKVINTFRGNEEMAVRH